MGKISNQQDKKIPKFFNPYENKISERKLKILKWRWEFMRRNEDYQKEYQSIIEEQGKIGPLPSINNWGLGEWINPNLSFDELYEQCCQEALAEFKGDDIDHKGAAEYALFNRLGGFNDPGYTIVPQFIALDPECRNNKLVGFGINDVSTPDTDIIEEIMKWIRKERLRQNLPQKIDRKKPKWEKYDQYIEDYVDIMELKEKGWSNPKIIEELWGELIDYDTGNKRIRRAIKKVEGLIKGGYGKIK